jgi:nicotinic acid mononucleotide adenylyltransferase
LRRSVPFVVVGRGGFSGQSDVVMPAVSSTEIRARLRADEAVDGLVSRSVLDYIRERRLYLR